MKHKFTALLIEIIQPLYLRYPIPVYVMLDEISYRLALKS